MRFLADLGSAIERTSSTLKAAFLIAAVIAVTVLVIEHHMSLSSLINWKPG